MASNEFLATDSRSVNGVYKFDSGVIWIGLIAGSIGLLLCLGLGIASAEQGSRSVLLCLPISLLLVAFLVHVGRLSGRSLQVNDEGVSVRDKKGNPIGGLQWTEWGNVTERRKMAQLALWDKSGARRVLIDQQYQNFDAIRYKVLAEYAKAFTLKPLPITFQRSNPVMYESIIFALGSGLFCWAAWMAFQQRQRGASVFLLCFAAASLVSLLNHYPQMRGPSVLFEDRIVLRSLFKTQEIYKKSVRDVEIGNVANPQSGTKFSLVILQIVGGKPLRLGPGKRMCAFARASAFSPQRVIPPGFLDHERRGRLHLLIRNRLLGRPVGGCVLQIG